MRLDWIVSSVCWEPSFCTHAAARSTAQAVVKSCSPTSLLVSLVRQSCTVLVDLGRRRDLRITRNEAGHVHQSQLAELHHHP